MSSATPTRLAVLCSAMWLAAAGCAPSAVAPTGEISARVPQRIVLPDHIRPLPAAPLVVEPADESLSVPAQFQQPQTNAAPARPRIVELSTSNKASPATGGAIREPEAKPPEVTEPATATNPLRRSEFVPIAMPKPTSPPSAVASPELPSRPMFAFGEASRTATPTDAPHVTQPGIAPPVMAPPVMAPPVMAPPVMAPPVTQPPISVAADGAVVAGPPESPAASDRAARPEAVAVQPAQPPRSTPPVGSAQSAAMQTVAQRAMQMADQASAMAQRGMLFSARTELIQALQLVVQALDVQDGDARHASALAAGLAALDEARDFSAKSTRPGEAVNVAAISATHRTPLLQGEASATISPVIAQQQYFGLAQSQLVAAAGGVPAASQILYRLGRLQTLMAAHDTDPLALNAPQAIVFHQASLAIDGGNSQAANELGVLMARYGQLPEARRLLIHSVSMRPQVETWQNLAVVHRRLGEIDLALRAEHERQLLAKQLEKSPDSSADMVRWVDPQTFAASGGPEVQGPAYTAGKTAAAAPGAARR